MKLKYTRILLIFAGVILSANLSWANENLQLHGTIKVIEEKSDKPGNIQLQFVVVPNEGLKLSFEAPWKLELSEAQNLQLTKTNFAKDDIDQKHGAFKTAVELKPEKPQSLKYKLIAFICTKDATRCYRDVFESQYTFK